ncbi:MAG: metal ABC transporter permease [Deltaproteobacteria bacterium]|nr:metal ABC transporter permease [Deltaproteobacteria bacterium]
MTPSETATWGDFVEGLPIFRDAILCGVAAGAVLGPLGVYVVLRRMVFVTAALSQAAGLGVAVSFYCAIHLGLDVPPIVGAIVTSLLVTVALAGKPEWLGLSRESVLGLAYLAGGALAVAVGDRIAQEAHDIASILFGTAVLVRPLDLTLLLGASAVVAVVLIVGHRGFVAASFDPDGARVRRVPVAALDLTLWFLVALEVSVATRALGVLPVFGFSVLPAMGALMSGVRMSRTLVLASILGAASGGLGYVAAFFFSFPVGASQTLAAGLLLVPFAIARLVRRDA